MSRVVSDEQLAAQRKIRRRREKAATKANVGIAWVDAEGRVDPRAPQLPKRPKTGGV